MLKDVFSQIDSNYMANTKKSENDYLLGGILYCGNCHTPKQIKINKFGYQGIHNCLCKCEEKNRELEQSFQAQLDYAEKIKRFRDICFSDERLKYCTFENDDNKNKKTSDYCKKYVEDFDLHKQNGTGIIFYGNVGSGKTFFASAIANSLIDKGHKCLVTNFSKLINIISETFDKKQKFVDNLNRFSLLVIDDLAIERNTEFTNEIIYNIIDSRYNSGKPMIITTNLNISQINNPDTIFKQRVYSRISEKCDTVPVLFENRRNKKMV